MDLSEVKNLPKVDHTPAELDAVSRALLAAADLMDKAGYHCTNGAMLDYKGGYCTWGALDEVAAGMVCHQAMMRMLRALGHTADGDKFHSKMPVCDWNNSHTKDEVVAKLRAVALGG